MLLSLLKKASKSNFKVKKSDGSIAKGAVEEAHGKALNISTCGKKLAWNMHAFSVGIEASTMMEV